MPPKKPQRRLRFFALGEDRFQVQRPVEGQPGSEPSFDESPPAAPTAGEQTEAAEASEAPPAPDMAGEGPALEPAAPLDTLAPGFRAVRAPSGHPERGRPPLVLLAGASLVCLALGLLGGYLLPRPAATANTPAAGPGSPAREISLPKPLAQDTENALDAAFAARHANQYAQAEQKFADLARQHPGWDMMPLEISRTMLYQSNLRDAQTTLQTALDRGLMPADAYFLLGTVYMAGKAYRQADESFAQATALDPSRADFYYFWGDCLRDEGKVRDATAKFHSALLRNQYETSEGLYRLKWWLSAIEADQEGSDGIGEQIDAALARPRPPMEALFAAAARALKDGDFQTAVSRIFRARRRTDPRIFRVILGDPVFVPLRTRPEWAQLSRPAPAAGQGAAPDTAASAQAGSIPAPPAKGK